VTSSLFNAIELEGVTPINSQLQPPNPLNDGAQSRNHLDYVDGGQALQAVDDPTICV
jgi:hypothetical protein